MKGSKSIELFKKALQGEKVEEEEEEENKNNESFENFEKGLNLSTNSSLLKTSSVDVHTPELSAKSIEKTREKQNKEKNSKKKKRKTINEGEISTEIEDFIANEKKEKKKRKKEAEKTNKPSTRKSLKDITNFMEEKSLLFSKSKSSKTRKSVIQPVKKQSEEKKENVVKTSSSSKENKQSTSIVDIPKEENNKVIIEADKENLPYFNRISSQLREVVSTPKPNRSKRMDKLAEDISIISSELVQSMFTNAKILEKTDKKMTKTLNFDKEATELISHLVHASSLIPNTTNQNPSNSGSSKQLIPTNHLNDSTLILSPISKENTYEETSPPFNPSNFEYEKYGDLFKDDSEELTDIGVRKIFFSTP
ncbi:hypothetical protein ABK040_002972 [Willaertia magna]